MTRLLLPLLVLAASASGCAPPASAPPAAGRAAEVADTTRLMADLRVLAADSMEGRLVGTPGGARARRFLLGRFEEIGLVRFGASYEQSFEVVRRDSARVQGVNLIGYVRGTTHPDRFIVVTAHYDHLGTANGQIFNGADDNASGTSALLELARHVIRTPPRHSVIFAALDAEEGGLRGAVHFVANPPVPRRAMLLNVNMDMVGRNDRNELYAAGTHHYPFLRPLLERIAPAAPVTLRFGHDSPDLPPSEDWTTQSDHAAFHRAGIPFVYFGVEDHPDYHRPTDTADRIQPAFYGAATTTVLRALRELDASLDSLDRTR
jgi:Zn-dependent M28 family amino/carboxypeptidase